MYLPPLQPVSSKDVYISGDVTIHPSAVLAPGVVLQATPNSRIIIGAEVSIGMGTIINAYQGSVEIGNGATLGAGVLIVGDSTIGSNACIGTTTTIFNASIDSMTVIAPGSLIGDTSRQHRIEETQNNHHQSSETQTLSSQAKVDEHNGFSQNAKPDTQINFETAEVNPKNQESTDNNSEVSDTTEVDFESSKDSSEVEQKPNSVVGQVYINQLLLTLFPHYQYSNPNSQQNELE